MAKKKRKRKKWTPCQEFLDWVAELNVWVKHFGWPPLIDITEGWEGAYWQAHQGAEASGEEFPTWDELTAGAKHGIVGWGFSMPRGSWLLEPRGSRDKKILQMARWGRQAATQAAPVTRRFSERPKE